jgi:hypothetical protein
MVVGNCIDCGKAFCVDCAVEIVRHGSVCLECGARFAHKKLVQAYVAAGLGFVIGLMIASQSASRNDWGFAIAAPFIYTYLFAAVFFGWHYGGKIWTTLSSISDHFSGLGGFVATIVVLSIRFWLAVFLGAFGGGITQYLRYRKIISSQKGLAMPALARVAA